MTQYTQTTYADRPAKAIAGDIADNGPRTITSYLCEDATIAAGKPVIQGTTDDEAKLGGTGTLLGFTLNDRTLLPDDGDVYKEKGAMAILEKGSIWVIAGEAVEAGDQVYRTSGGALVDTATDNFICPGWFFVTTAANAALVKIRRI